MGGAEKPNAHKKVVSLLCIALREAASKILLHRRPDMGINLTTKKFSEREEQAHGTLPIFKQKTQG